MNIKSFYTLWISRNKEFFRDKGSLSWAFLFPILIIIGCAIAFSGGEKKILIIGYYPAGKQPDIVSTLDPDFGKFIAYDDLAKARARLADHQLHLVIDESTHQIWTNRESSHSRLAKELVQGKMTGYQFHELSGKPIRYVDWVVPGVLSMNLMFGSLFGVGYSLVRYRKNGVLKRLHATPVTAFRFLAAQVASRLFIVVSANALIFAGSYLLLGLKMTGSFFDLLIITLCGATAMISLGLLIASRTASEELAGGILNAATWPMTFLSGIWFSLDDTPKAMQVFAEFLPLTHLVNAARNIMLNGASLMEILPDMAIMLIMALVCLSLAARLFRWHG